jgi:hypothetical protein
MAVAVGAMKPTTLAHTAARFMMLQQLVQMVNNATKKINGLGALTEAIHFAAVINFNVRKGCYMSRPAVYYHSSLLLTLFPFIHFNHLTYN